MANSRQQMMLEAPLGLALFYLTVPIFLGNILQMGYQLTDAFWVGRLGVIAVAAVAICAPVTFLVIAAGAGFAIAGATLSAQYAGAGRQDLVNKVAAQTFLAITPISIALAACGYLLSPRLLHGLGVESGTFADALGFMRMSFIGIFFVFFYAMFQALMRGIGQMRIPLLLQAATVGLNFLLDPLFIFGWGPFPAHGVTGAAMATLLTQGIAASVGLAMLLRGRYGIQLKGSHFIPDLAYIKHAFSLGSPGAIEMLSRGLGPMAMASLAAGLGTATLASYGVGSSILQMVTIPAMSLSMAVATLCGQNIGGGKAHRAAKVVVLGAVAGFIALTLVGIITYICASEAVSFFVPRNALLVAQGADFVRMMCLTWGCLAVQLCIVAAFRASGNMTAAMLITLLSQLVFQPCLAWFLSRTVGLGAEGLWMAFPATNILFALSSVAWFARRERKIAKPVTG